MNRLPFLFMAALFAAQALAVPEVSGVSVVQDARRRTRITYSLSSIPAVVTLDVQTNAADGAWISVTRDIGATNFTGDVWRRVESSSGVINWDPVASWPNVRLNKGASLRAVVTAFAPDDTPDYMVVDLAESSDSRTNYYPSVDLLPGGLMDNPAYRTSKLVLRKVLAKDVPWTMGSVCEPSAYDGGNSLTVPASKYAHPVQLTNNYYLAVFETTHAQWQAIMGGMPENVDTARFDVDGEMRPIEQAYPSLVRGSLWPSEPTGGSFLGTLRTRTGMDFDLPSEAQWEFACRAGLGEGVWNTGAAYSAQYAYYKEYNASGNNTYNGWHWWVGASIPGRCSTTDGRIAVNDNFYDVARASIGMTNGTAIVGSYPASAWGLYDMHGNVSELTLDFYKEDISALNGAVCSDSSSGKRVIRGGSIESRGVIDCRAAARSTVGYTGTDNGDRWAYTVGYRLCCRNGLK
jgi:formylglycine-generating enzyme required for sulfatase activity